MLCSLEKENWDSREAKYFTQEHSSTSKPASLWSLLFKIWVTKSIVQEVTESVSSGTYLACFLLCSNLRQDFILLDLPSNEAHTSPWRRPDEQVFCRPYLWCFLKARNKMSPVTPAKVQGGFFITKDVTWSYCKNFYGLSKAVTVTQFMVHYEYHDVGIQRYPPAQGICSFRFCMYKCYWSIVDLQHNVNFSVQQCDSDIF